MRVLTIDDAIRRAAEQQPEKLALADPPNRDAIFGGAPKRLTWSEVDQAINNLAAALRGLGAEPNVAIGVQLPNVVELVITILACGRIGAIAVPFPVQHRRHELEYGLGAASARIMVTGARPDRPDQLEIVSDVVDRLEQPVRIATFGSQTTESATGLTIDTTPST